MKVEAIDIFEEFILYNPTISMNMRDTTQYYSDSRINKYHYENDVWSHTCLCFNHFLNNLNHDYENDLLISILVSIICHDIGKCYTKNKDHNKKKCTFYGHSYASIQETVNFIYHLNRKGFINDINRVLSLTLTAISNHIDIYQETTKRKELMMNLDEDLRTVSSILFKCDSAGSISPKDSKKKCGINFYENPFVKLDSVKYKKTIYIYCGVPGVGKDFLAEKKKLPILSFDDIRIQEFLKKYPHSKYTKEIYELAFQYCNEKKINLLQILKKKIDELNSDVIICNTNCNKKSRRTLVSSFGKVNFKAVYIVSETLKIIEKDLKRNSKTVGHQVIEKFIYNQQIPTLKEGFDSVEIIAN